jgi:hypothetical protein
MKNILWSWACVLFAVSICPAQSVLYFPHFVDGSQGEGTGWGTVIAITNPAAIGTPAATGSITLMKEDGTPMDLGFTDDTGNPVPNTFELGGGQVKFFSSANNSAKTQLPLSVGFVTITSNLPITGTSVFQEFNSNGVFAFAGVPSATPLTRQTIVAIITPPGGGSVNTGIAVVNPSTATTTITFQLLDQSGALAAPQVTRTLAANRHTSFFVSELFPQPPSAFFGTVRITSDQAIVSTALLFQGPTFATFPVFPLP